MRIVPKPAGYHWDQKEPVVRSDGLPPCRWCKGPVQPPRRVWCGNPACHDEWQIRISGQAGCRAICEAIDHGVCALCELDTRQVEREYAEAVEQAFQVELSRLIGPPAGRDSATIRALCYHHGPEARRRARVCADGVRIARQFNVPWKRLINHRTLWEADHIVPVVEGGDFFDPGNLRTLCIACHKAETAKLARRRARKKVPG
jgi:5-methylcytosine-specific restriction enzyme A